MLEVSHLTLTLSDSSAKTPLVRDVSFVVRPNETYALVGESGCGKSLTALSLMRLLPEGVSVQEGSVLCGGRDLFTLTEREMNAVRGAGISLIFQEPATSLNPVIRVGEQIREVLTLHPNVCPDASPEAVSRWLARVGFDDPERIAKSFPHELSGGQKQRVMIAMALAASPSVVVADEPTTALDVTLQAQILDLLRDLKRERHLALLLITHDLALVRHYADRVGLMYAGQILEEAPVKDFFSKPLHPYAAGLLRAVPQSASRKKVLAGIPGVVPGPGEVVAGYLFTPYVVICQMENPDLVAVFPEEGIGFGIDSLAIPANAPHPQNAHLFLDYLLRPEVAAHVAEWQLYTIPNLAAGPLISEETKQYAALNVPEELLATKEYVEDVGEYESVYQEIWMEFKLQ